VKHLSFLADDCDLATKGAHGVAIQLHDRILIVLKKPGVHVTDGHVDDGVRCVYHFGKYIA